MFDTCTAFLIQTLTVPGKSLIKCKLQQTYFTITGIYKQIEMYYIIYNTFYNFNQIIFKDLNVQHFTFSYSTL